MSDENRRKKWLHIRDMQSLLLSSRAPALRVVESSLSVVVAVVVVVACV
jgi:hypothetical protein